LKKYGITRGKFIFVHLFSTIFHFSQGFNPPIDDFCPLIQAMGKDNLLAFSNLQVNEICPGNLVSNNDNIAIQKIKYIKVG